MFAGTVYDPDELGTPWTTVCAGKRLLSLASLTIRLTVEGSEASDVQEIVIGCVGSRAVPGVGEVNVKAEALERNPNRLTQTATEVCIVLGGSAQKGQEEP